MYKKGRYEVETIKDNDKKIKSLTQRRDTDWTIRRGHFKIKVYDIKNWHVKGKPRKNIEDKERNNIIDKISGIHG